MVLLTRICTRISTLEKSCVHYISMSACTNRLRSEWRRDRKPANTKLDNENVTEIRKAYGGGKKEKAVTVNSGNYKLNSKNIDKNLQIVDVIHSDAGKKYREENIIVKGTVVAVDGSDILPDIQQSVLSEHYTQDIKEHIKQLVSQGRLYAKVTTRPGQVGKCDGYILEGDELGQFVAKLKDQQLF